MVVISEIVIAAIVFILAANVAFLLLLSRNYRRSIGAAKVEPKVDAELVIPAATGASRIENKPTLQPGEPPSYEELIGSVRRFMQVNGSTDSGKAMANLIRAIFLDQSAFTMNTLQALPAPAQRDALGLLGAYLSNALSFEDLEALHDFAQICSGATQPDSLASDV